MSQLENPPLELTTAQLATLARLHPDGVACLRAYTLPGDESCVHAAERSAWGAPGVLVRADGSTYKIPWDALNSTVRRI